MHAPRLRAWTLIYRALMEQLLRELGHALRAQADDALLDLPLDHLCNRVTDADARELFEGLFASGAGSDLRALLEDDGLTRYVVESCTVREAEAMVRQLRRWLGDEGAGGDDPERLARVAALPVDAEGIYRWADDHGLARMLHASAAAHLGSARVSAELSLIDVCLGRADRFARGASLLAGGALAEDARAVLLAAAQRRAAQAAREALHRRLLPPAALGLLARRLRAMFDEHPLDALAKLRFVPARPVEVARATGLAQGALVTRPGEPSIAVALHLSGFEQRAIEGRCSACTTPRCAHLAALAARLFEACLDPDDRLHAPLAKLVSVPSWQRFLDALAPDHGARADASTRERLSFVVRHDGPRLSIGVLAQRPRADGRLSPGKLVSASKLARAGRASDRDQVVLAALAARTRTLGPQYVVADLMVLRTLVEHPSVLLEQASAGGADPIRTPTELCEAQVEVTLREQPEGLSPRVTLAGAQVAAARGARDLGYVVQHDALTRRLTFAALGPPLERLLDALAHFRGVLPPESYPQVATWVETIRRVADVAETPALAGLARPPPDKLLLRITPRYDEGIDLSLHVRALPLAPLWAPGQGPELVQGLVDGKASSVRRTLSRERDQASQVRAALGLDALLALGPDSFRVETNQAALALLAQAARLTHLLELEWAERARPLRVSGTIGRGDLKVGLFKRGDFCALTGGVQQGEALIAIDRLLEAARTGERFVPIGGGDFLEIEAALFDRLHEAQLCTLSMARARLLPTAAAKHWLSALGTETKGEDGSTEDWLARVRSSESNDADVALPPAFDGVLRSYQRAGIAFLLGVSRWAPGACLADEMGLGKTVQAIGCLLARADLGPQLVVAPTSVVDNWLAELVRFAPSLTRIDYRGSARAEGLAALSPNTIVVTSFEILLRDRAQFDGISFATLVVDEAQVLRNARTLRAQAASSLTAAFRIALTGTPIENRLGDLWSLFHLIAPGLLGSWARFRARFAVPIERYEKEERAEALRQLVAPLMLRREKRDVAPELPPRTEVVRLITLSPAERDLYGAALVHARRALGKRTRDEAARTVQILAQLTRLRQLACHPRLVLGDSRVGSSKLTCLVELLDDLLPRGHRVLVFSQFTSHLALVREAVTASAASFLELDGRTPPSERAERVARFQRGEAQLFLISLKAGGTGLNLTAADYVVHMDPWWNPTSEDQASDRAHRIGQQKPVTVVKLVSADTIEERVLALHAHKRRLAGSILDGPAPTALPPTVAELEALLEDT